MAKLLTMFLLLIAIQACLLIYGDSTPESTDLWTFVTNIDNWNSLTFILTLGSIAAGIGLIGVAGSTIFGFKTDFLIMAAAITGIISMGTVIVNLANVIGDELQSRIFTSCVGTAVTCTPINWILAITVGPLAFIYVWTVIEWWKNKDF